MATNLSTEPDDYRQRLAMMLTQQGLDSSPIRSPWQGVARLAQALAGGMETHAIAGDQQAANQRVADFLLKMGGPGAPSQPGAPQTAEDEAGNFGGSPATNPNLVPLPAGEPPMRTASLPPMMRGAPSPMPPAPTGPMAAPAGPSAPGSFNDRWGAVTDAVKDGTMDPQGQNYSQAFASAAPPVSPQAPMMPSPNGPGTFAPMLGGPPPQKPPAVAQGGPPGAPGGMPPPMPPQPQQAPQGPPQGGQQPQPGGFQDPAIRAKAAAIISDPRADPALKQMILQQLLPKDSQIMQMPDGTVIAVNARNGTTTKLYQATPKPEIVPEGASMVGQDGKPLYASPSKPQIVPEGGSLIGSDGKPIFQGQPKAPPGYEWDSTQANKALKPIAGGPESKLPGNTGGQIALMDSSMTDWPQTRETLLAPWGIKGTVGHITGSFDVGRAQRNVSVAIEAALRTMSGAAVPPAEVERYKSLYMPMPYDTRQTAEQKLNNLETFMKNAKTNALQGRVANPPALGGQPSADPLGIR